MLLLCSNIITNSLFQFCISSSVAQFILFLDNRIYFPSKTDKCQVGELLSEFKYKTVLSALTAKVNSTEILIAVRIARSSTQYCLYTTWCSQLRKSELDIEPFWETSSADPPLKWEKWQMQAKLVLLAKEKIALDTLLEPKPKNVQLLLEPIYEITITGSSAQSEREGLARNAQSKMNWKKRCRKQIEIRIMCGDNSCLQPDRKTVSMLFLSLAPKEGESYVSETRISRWIY